MKNIWLKPHQIDWKSKLVFLVSTFTVSAAFNVATSNHDQLAYPDPNTEFPAFFGYSLSVTDPDTNQILIGSPKERQPTDGATGTAQLLRSEYDEQYASGNLHSCTLELDSINPQTCAASARPNTSSGNDHIVTNRNAFGLSLGANRQNPAEVTLCSPNEGIACDDRFYILGSCYTSTDGGENWSAPLEKEEPSCGFVGTTDLFFILDGSASVNFDATLGEDVDNFGLVLGWVLNVTKEFFVNSDSYYIGVLQYSKEVRFIVTLPDGTPGQGVEIRVLREVELGEFSDYAEFKAAVERINYTDGHTHTARAIRLAHDLFLESPRYNNSDNRQIAIVLTDGLADDDGQVENTSKLARQDGIEFFAIGVGDYELTELLGITNTTEPPESNDRVFVLDDFSDLNDIVGSVQRSISSRLEESLGSAGQPEVTSFLPLLEAPKEFHAVLSTLFMLISAHILFIVLRIHCQC